MLNNSMGSGGAAPCRRGASVSFRALVLLLTAGLLGGRAPDSASAEVLRWKFKTGEVLRYSMEQKMVTTTRGADARESKSTRSQTVDMSWRVNRLTSGGGAEITQRIDRIRMRVEQAPLMPLEFDSNVARTDAQDPFPDVTKQLRAMVGAEFIFQIKPTGEIEDIRFPEPTLKALRDAAPRGAPEGEVSEKVLKDMLSQSSPPAFPAGQLEAGQTWSDRPARLPIGIGTLVMNKTYTLQQPDPQTPRLIRVGVETRVALEPAAGANVSAEIRKQEGKGTLTFDAEAGHIVTTRGTQRIDLAITQMDQKVDSTTETTTSMTLVP